MMRFAHWSRGAVIGALLVNPCAKSHAPATLTSASLPATTRFVVHCERDAHSISPFIYGISAQSMNDVPGEWEIGATARRWGGNHTSRYNWKQGNALNTGNDWFFRNVDFGGGQTAPAYQRFLDEDLAHHVATTVTVPLIGWVAKDTTSYAFPVSIYGPQHATAPENADIGDGILPNGSPIAAPSCDRTSVAMPAAGIGEWVSTMRARDEARGITAARSYILDNEPTLWNEAHRDVHPDPVSYDELLQRTIAYGAEIRRADPTAIIAGPAAWGWDGCLRSGVDRAARPREPDRAAHGNTPLLPWWLREVRAHENRTGQRLVDVVDVHFYPQGQGIGIGTSGETDADTAARRIRSTRALWDPSYVDESWMAEPVSLVPHLKSWIAENAPGLGISIGEYNFGAERHMSGGLAVAEALGRFGALGVTSAFYWDVPAQDSPAFWAFRAFRNFDGAGGRFLDESVDAESANPGASIFASRDADGRHMVLVLLNLDPAASTTAVLDTASCGRVVTKKSVVYTGGAAGFVPAPSTALPPYSITVVDLTLSREP